MSSNNLFKWNRFDLPIKSIFLDFYTKKLKSSFGEEIYKEHLRLWNGFKEYDNPEKNSYEKFKSNFIDIFNDLKNSTFYWNVSPIIVDNKGYLLNGSHRAAAALYLNQPTIIKEGIDLKDGQKICDFKLFQSLNLPLKYQDASALELVRRNKNLVLLHLFPSAEGKRLLVEEIIEKYSNIAYKKEIKLTKQGALNYMLQVYKGESWAGNWDNDFEGYRDKTNLCFRSNEPMIAYLIDTSNAKTLKNEIRSLYNIGNHSVHINDTHEETLRLSRCLFNENSIHFLNNSKFVNYTKFSDQLKYYEQYLIDNNLNFEEYCITASSVLSLYGIREGNDLDYIHFNKHIIQGHSDIHSHNEYGIGRYSKEIDDIIFNPDNHFYYGNIKVASLDIIKELKKKRKEDKDIKDINLINQLTKNIKIMFCGFWGESSTDMLKRYSNQTPNNSGKWGNIEGVDNPNEADYFIIMDGAPDEIWNNLDWSKVIFFQREPDYVRPLVLNHNFPDDLFYKGTWENIHLAQTWWTNVTFNDLVNLKYPTKTKKISTITSGKEGLEIYKNRLNFLKDFCNQYDNIDVYGRGISNIVGKSYRGELNYNGNCKFKGHIDYEYSIILENILDPNTWTEKPSDSYLAWSLPIYSGASNFQDFFPEESFYKIDTLNYNINNIIDFIKEPPSKIQIEALKEARNLLLYKWNIWPTIEKIINEN